MVIPLWLCNLTSTKVLKTAVCSLNLFFLNFSGGSVKTCIKNLRSLAQKMPVSWQLVRKTTLPPVPLLSFNLFYSPTQVWISWIGQKFYFLNTFFWQFSAVDKLEFGFGHCKWLYSSNLQVLKYSSLDKKMDQNWVLGLPLAFLALPWGRGLL